MVLDWTPPQVKIGWTIWRGRRHLNLKDVKSDTQKYSILILANQEMIIMAAPATNSDMCWHQNRTDVDIKDAHNTHTEMHSPSVCMYNTFCRCKVIDNFPFLHPLKQWTKCMLCLWTFRFNQAKCGAPKELIIMGVDCVIITTCTSMCMHYTWVLGLTMCINAIPVVPRELTWK